MQVAHIFGVCFVDDDTTAVAARVEAPALVLDIGAGGDLAPATNVDALSASHHHIDGV